VLGAFVGQSSRLMPTLNQTFPAPSGLDNPLVTGLLLVCGVTIVIALLLSLVGLIRGVPLTAAGPLKPAVGGYQAAPSSS